MPPRKKMPLKKTTPQWIEEAKKVHGERYDYSQTIYEGCKKKLKIICDKHGLFEQRAQEHLRGSGCPKCASNYNYSNEEWKEKAHIKHHNKFDYSKVIYINCKTKVIIICPNHGEYLQNPSVHMRTNGCALCTLELRKIGLKEFIRLSNVIHNNKYNYSESIYINSITKLIIICPDHGRFLQTPENHFRYEGCKHCLHETLSLGQDEFIRRSNIIQKLYI
jgi:hypothetical protein